MKCSTLKTAGKRLAGFSWIWIPTAFFLIEVFSFLYIVEWRFSRRQVLPLLWGLLWSVTWTSLLALLPRKVGRVLFGVLYFAMLVYSIGQTGYYLLFNGMMWIAGFLNASEGADYLNILTRYPISWFVWAIGLIGLWIILMWKYPLGQLRKDRKAGCTAAAALVLSIVGILNMPKLAFSFDNTDINDFLLDSSMEVKYNSMLNPLQLYQICGIYHTPVKDIYEHSIAPRLPWKAEERKDNLQRIDRFFEQHSPEEKSDNAMTGLLKDKNVILVLMESMDDWMLGEHTPTISRLMAEGIQFVNFYTPPYGSVRTFNSEMCINTGTYLSSQSGYTHEFVGNEMNQSLAATLKKQGYSAKLFHFNDPSFYGRNHYSVTMGYEEYVYYWDYMEDVDADNRDWMLNDDTILFTIPELRKQFYRDEGKLLNLLITNAAHMTYTYDDFLSAYGLTKYPQYRGLTGHEETDCTLLKAKLLDDLFEAMLISLEEEGLLEDTVIIGVADHYTYGYTDQAELLRLSGVDRTLLLEKTPCFIWSPELEPMKVEKTLNTSDLLPTLLNLLGIEPEYEYLGQDAFDDSYEGYAIFTDGSWITNGIAYDAQTREILRLSPQAPEETDELRQRMNLLAGEYVSVNNLIMSSDYYRE